jgi:23S rRNA (adenine-N6)-dimethyltransferase
VSGQSRSARDQRRRTHAQNFLRDRRLADLIASTLGPADLVVELGAGDGALTLSLASTGARVLAVEVDPVWAARLRDRLAATGFGGSVEVVVGDLLEVPLPRVPYRLVCNVPFHLTTALLRRLLDRPTSPLQRADLVVQLEVARKRAVRPPATLLSAAWAPWWQVELVCRVPRSAFRPVPTVDAGWLAVTRREPPVLPAERAADFGRYLRSTWLAPDRDPL